MRVSGLAPFLLSLLVLTPGIGFAECDTSGLPDGTDVVDLQLTNGSFCLELLTADAPIHVENFLWYVQNAQYDASLFHRFLTGFILQGGNQRRNGVGGWEVIPARNDDDVLNEPCTDDCDTRGNIRGTVALAKLPPEAPGGGPDSGSTNWFINLADNRANLDNQNGGFTVFARVMGNGMDYVDSLHNLNASLKTLVSGQFANGEVALTEQPPYDDYTGCLDPLDTAIGVGISPNPGLPNTSFVMPKADPRGVSGFYFLPLSCGGTLVADPGSFVPNPCTGLYTSEDELAVEVEDSVSLVYPTPLPPPFYRFTCEEVDVAVGALDEFEALFTPRYEDRFVYIETATHLVVPEPSASLLIAAATLTLLALRRASTRSPARRRHPSASL